MELITGILEIFKSFFELIKGKIGLIELSKNMLKIFLIIITANILYVWWFGNYIWIPLTKENIWTFITTGEVFHPLICLLVAYYFFYGLIYSLFRRMLNYILHKQMTKLLHKMKSKLTASEKSSLKSLLIKVMKGVFGLMISTRIVTSAEMSQVEITNDIIIEMEDDFYSVLAIFIHGSAVYFYYHRFLDIGVFIIFFVAIIIFGFFAILPPVMVHSTALVNQVIKDEPHRAI